MKKVIQHIYSGVFLFCIVFSVHAGPSLKDTLDIQEVVVTATKTKVNKNNTPLSISIVTRQEIERSSESALLPVLSQRVPGLFVTQRGITGFGVSTGSAGTVNIRGVGSGNKVLMLFDGQPQWAGIYGHSLPDTYVASDVPAILKYTRNVYYIGNLEFAKLVPGEAHFYDLNGDEIEKETTEIKWDAEAAEKAGFEHFMMKEIHEQPKAIRDTINSVVRDGKIDLSGVGITEEEIQKLQQIYIVACGSAYHVGVAAQYVIEELAQIPVRVELASEFRYRRMLFAPNSLVIIVSQSGETADSLAALREAKDHGVKTLAIVNVVGSTIAREADHVFYTLAGPEIAVATTKAYSTQLIASYILSIEFARVRGMIDEDRAAELIAELQTIPDKIEKLLEDKERIQWFAAKQMNAQNMFFIGRGIDYAVSLEGSLKMKEISYIHSEAYAAGELKHGTISLIEPGTLVIGVLTQQDLYEKTVSNMVECKSRGAYLMALTTYGNYSIEDCAEFVIYIPKTDPLFAASLAVIPLQLMGYYVSVAKGLDVDKPRNLAKSVTVE